MGAVKGKIIVRTIALITERAKAPFCLNLYHALEQFVEICYNTS